MAAVGNEFGLWAEELAEGKEADVINSFYNAQGSSFLITNNAAVTNVLKGYTDARTYAIVPDLTQYVREMTQSGVAAMAIKKAKALGPLNLLKLGMPALLRARRLLKKDMCAILPLLVNADYLMLRKIKPRILFMHYQLTDMALANGNEKLLRCYLGMPLGKKVTLGLMTKNLSLLVQKLSEWDLEAKAILAPFNRRGFAMRNSKEECENLLGAGDAGREYYSFGTVRREELKEELQYLGRLNVKKMFLRLV